MHAAAMSKTRFLLFFLKNKDKKHSRVITKATTSLKTVLSKLNNKKPHIPIQSIKQSGLFSNIFIIVS